MLIVDKLSQAYGGSQILRDVGFDAHAGKVTVLLGRNGVGKSTLLRTLMGIHAARSGTVTLDGRSLGGLPPNRRAEAGIGYVPQGREIFPRLTVEENLRIGFATGRMHMVPDRSTKCFPCCSR
jgi:urea transport system ATP-binding protein